MGGIFDHIFILLQIEKEDSKHPISFKFNFEWLEDEFFINLMELESSRYDPFSRECTSLQLVLGLCKFNVAISKWAHAKRNRDEKTLILVDEEI